ncbi:MAG: sensor histidine kinase [Planctomycetes bacterium]|nr:sensor histidine kinase [Planctomycetota bacterium]
MLTQLCVRADAHSILRNILNYFSDNFACIQELLQNARRAEASDVRVEIDTRVGSVTVTDNGHGVFDPQDLINIGKSDWSEGVGAERPAGMGLFSVFKLGGLAEVRSGRWRLTLAYDALCAGKPAVYEGLLPAVKGTQVRVSRLHHEFGGHDMPHVEGYALQWQRQAEFMPFRTTIVVDGASRIVEPYSPLAVPKGALRVDTSWGFIDLHTEPPGRGDHAGVALIQQGISTRLKGLSGPSDMAWVRIHARPGTVSFTLPDRDAIIEDAAYRNLVAEVQQALVQAVIGRIFQFGDDKARRRLASLVYAWNPLRVIELPPDLQHLQLRQDRDYLYTLTRQQVAERLAKGVLASAFEPQYHTALELVPNEMLQLASGQAALFKTMFPDVPLITELRFGITADDRSDLLWRCESITYRFDTGDTREVQPVPEQTVLADGDLEGEFVPDDRDRANFRSGNDFAVVHSCADAVAYPNLDPWHAWHEEELDHDQADELWRTSDLAVHIAATWPGVPANDVTPDELVTLLRDRLADGKDCRLRFANAKFELGWGNQLSIQSMLVKVVENGKVTRKVCLVENCGYLQEVTP